jgi:Response regulators consisting of a CheY-like receiver domain and a winged-helix DNA-binding domain
MPKVLLVDDDLVLSKMLKQELEAQSWHVEHADCCGDGKQLLEQFKYDLILLDWSLPDGTGFDLCKHFRSLGGTTPVIFLTGKNDIDSKEAGLDIGADDYLTKPFDVRELMARVRSLLRRPSGFLQKGLTINGVELDTKSSQIVYGNHRIRLSQTELAILEFFFRNPNRLVPSVELFEAVWPSDTDVREDTVRVHILILRRKLDLAGLKEMIKTVRGSGYILEAQV